jgi:cation diffusion facilitator family transporter
MLTVASRPADHDHAFGHTKAEYFSSAFEGVLVLLAAAGIVFTALRRLLSPRPLEDVGLGLAVSVLASLMNLGAALVIGRAGRRTHSISLQANSQHLMTDVWTSAGVLAGVAATKLTGWMPLDPLVAILVGSNIAWTGVRILKRSFSGLMDSSLPESELASIRDVLDRYGCADVRFRDMRTRVSGYRRFVALTVLVPGDWPVTIGHDLLDRIEADLRSAVRDLTVVTHMEGIAADLPGAEDPRS